MRNTFVVVEVHNADGNTPDRASSLEQGFKFGDACLKTGSQMVRVYVYGDPTGKGYVRDRSDANWREIERDHNVPWRWVKRQRHVNKAV